MFNQLIERWMRTVPHRWSIAEFIWNGSYHRQRNFRTILRLEETDTNKISSQIFKSDTARLWLVLVMRKDYFVKDVRPTTCTLYARSCIRICFTFNATDCRNYNGNNNNYIWLYGTVIICQFNRNMCALHLQVLRHCFRFFTHWFFLFLTFSLSILVSISLPELWFDSFIELASSTHLP